MIQLDVSDFDEFAIQSINAASFIQLSGAFTNS